jgi:outer membrane protein assembly factor BamB
MSVCLMLARLWQRGLRTAPRTLAFAAAIGAGPALIASKPAKFPEPVFPMTVRWTVEIAAAPVEGASPVADERRAFVAMRNGQVVARALADGSEAWRRDLATEGPLALDNGLLFVAAADAVHALKAADGSLAWELPRPAIAAPLVARSGWLIVTARGKVSALRAADGSVVWERSLGKITEAPTILGDRLYVSAQDGRVMALTLATGGSIWEQQLPGSAGRVSASGDRVYVAGGDKHFYCLIDKDGGIDWDVRVGAGIVAPPVVDEDQVYYIALDNVLRAHNRISGVQKWQHGLRRRPGAGPAVIHDWVIVPSSSSAEIWAWTAEGLQGNSLGTGENPAVAPYVLDAGPQGARFLVVTGALAGVWHLSLIATAADPPLVPLKELPGRIVDVK